MAVVEYPRGKQSNVHEKRTNGGRYHGAHLVRRWIEVRVYHRRIHLPRIEIASLPKHCPLLRLVADPERRTCQEPLAEGYRRVHTKSLERFPLACLRQLTQARSSDRLPKPILYWGTLGSPLSLEWRQPERQSRQKENPTRDL